MRMAVAVDKTQNPNQVCGPHPRPWSPYSLLTVCGEGKEQTKLQTQPEGKGTAGDDLEMKGAPGSSQIPIHWARLEPR